MVESLDLNPQFSDIKRYAIYEILGKPVIEYEPSLKAMQILAILAQCLYSSYI
jgi:hypothetical protein